LNEVRRSLLAVPINKRRAEVVPLMAEFALAPDSPSTFVDLLDLLRQAGEGQQRSNGAAAGGCESVSPPVELAPGVKLERHAGFDSFTGDAAALVAAGVVEARNLPGAPGLRKTIVRLLEDGTVAADRRYMPFIKVRTVIERRGARRFTVRVRLSREEEEQRRREWSAVGPDTSPDSQPAQFAGRALPCGWRVVTGGAEGVSA
jgi:hypothetical protein